MADKEFRVWLQMDSLDALAGLTVDSACMPRRKRADGTIEITAVVTEETLKKLRRKRAVAVELLGDTMAEAKVAAGQVSRTNRYADGSLPVALGLREVPRVD